jgi:hypothetical protein
VGITISKSIKNQETTEVFWLVLPSIRNLV